METSQPTNPPSSKDKHHMRFHLPHTHLTSAFGPGWFGGKAEGFARWFGTPTFLISQTIIVAIWMVMNCVAFDKGLHFDEYPFILLNLAFSLQAAYAAPLILLAQTRQADRDKVLSEADAAHREDLAKASSERQALAASQTQQLVELMDQNTKLTEATVELSKRIEALTAQVHARIVEGSAPAA
jgi:uncharacterized membrane protein